MTSRPIPYTLAVVNEAGGVGKTTTSINVGGALNARGASVLLIDFDPQGALTEGVGMRDLYDRDILSLHDILTNLDRDEEINEVIQTHEEFDVIPSNIKLHNTANDLTNTVPASEKRLGGVLESLAVDYDYILVDCPPNYGQLSDNAIMAGTRTLVPVQAMRRSIRAVELLTDQIQRLEGGYEEPINRVGLVINQVEDLPNNDTQEMLDFFHGLDVPAVEVPERVAIRRAWNNGVSIFQHDDPAKTEDVRDAYREIAAMIAEAREAENPQEQEVEP